MQIQNAAPLIYTRTKYAGFRSGFVVQPGDFRESTARKLVRYAHDAMDSIAEMRSKHQYACVVIAEDGFVIAGISAYLRDLAKDGWEGTDKGGRLVYGFFGYVWHREDFTAAAGFPALEEFARILDDWIRPHWEDSENSKWAETLQTGGYTYTVDMQKAIPLDGYCPKAYRQSTVIGSAEEEHLLVQWALKQASRGEHVSACTNVCVYSERDLETCYQYITRMHGVGSSEKTEPENISPDVRDKPKEETKRKEEEYQAALSVIEAQTKHTGGGLPLLSVAGVLCFVAAAAVFVIGRLLPGMKSLGWICILLACLAAVVFVLQGIKRNPGNNKKPGEPTGSVVATSQKPVQKQTGNQVQKPPVSDLQKKPAKRETTEDVFRL